MSQLDVVWAGVLLVPDLVWHIATIAGLVGLVVAMLVRFIPFLGFYKLPIQIISLLALLAGVFMQGGMDCRNAGKQQNTAFREAEKKAEVVTQQVDEEVKKQDVKVEIRTQTQIKYIEKLVSTDPLTIKETITKDLAPEERNRLQQQIADLQKNVKECPIPSIVIEEMNKAAKGDKK